MIRRVLLLAALLCVPASAAAQTVAAGYGHMVILKSDGTVWTVGDNASGQLGDNTQTDRLSPVQVSGLTDIVAVAVGAFHSMALTSTGNLYVWGDNAYGQVGDASTTMRKTPVQLSLTNVVAMAAGSHHSIALRSNGDVHVWGRDNVGQLGDGTASSANTTSPAQLTTGAAAIAAGNEFTLVVKSDGTVYGTGENSNYQLGTGANTDRSTLGQMSGITTATAAAGGISHSFVLLSDGTVKGVGYNNFGNLGDGTTTQRTSPVTVGSLSNVTAIAGGYNHGVARKSDGTVWAWGRNHVGQVGNDDLGVDATSPVQLTSLSSISAIAACNCTSDSIAVTSDGVVYTWGHNGYYQIGDGTTINRAVPTPISEAGYDWKASTPTLNLAGGTYTTTQTVTVAVTMTGATIRYTQNGNEPTESDSSVASGSTVSVTESQTLKVKAFKSGMPASNTESAAYELQVVAVSVSPATGTYTSARTVTMSTSTSGATIRYTTDGSTPTEASTQYSSAINIATYSVVKAVGFKSGWSSSAATTRTYTFNYGTVPTPTADNGTGNYVDNVTVALSDTVAGATIRYTTNGSAVQPTSTIYTAPLAFDTTRTLKFKAYHQDYATASAEVTHTYTLSPAAPVFDPTAGTYVGGQLVTLSGTTTGATIRYTINGAEPTSNDPAIASGGTLVVGNYTLKAKAFKTDTTPSTTTTAIYAISGMVTPPAIAAGNEYSLAIRSDGVAWGWGENNYGQTGYGSGAGPLLLPKTVIGLTGAAAIDGGDTHTHVLTTGGSLLGFGNNGSGRLGDGTTSTRYQPTTITGVSAVVSARDGGDHTVVLKGDGTVYAWGENQYGQIGDGTTTDRWSPVQVPSLTAVTAIAAGANLSVALKQDGTIVAWGRNNSGQLGNGTETNSSSPVSVSSISTATAIATQYQHVLALLADGTVRAWGYNFNGQLGNGASGNGVDESSPVEVAGLDDVVAIDAGVNFSLALKDDGTVWSWGDNQHGQLGSGTTTDRSSPAQVSGLTDVVSIAAGGHHALALTSDGVVYVWGRNALGQLGDGTQTNRLSPVAISGPGMAWKVPTPTVSLASGLYYTNQSVTVTIPDPDATIRYTTTGQDPTSSDATVASGGTIAIDQSQTLKVSGWKTGTVTSVVVARTYELKAVTPAMTPGAGAYGSSPSVAMSTTTSGAAIRYTTDGSEPSASSTAYSSAVTVSETLTVKARAFKTGWTGSDSGHASYSVSAGTVAIPAITPAGGAQTAPPLVAMTTSTTGATIRYTLDGSTPTGSSPVFVYPFLANATTTVKAKAFKAGYTSSAVASTTFDVDASGATATPLMVPGGGWFVTGQTVTITGPSGATLRYTTDGSDPTTSSTSITSGNTITVDKSQVVKVRAWASGVDPSAIRRADFVITGAVSVGGGQSMALQSNGVLMGWGSDWHGRLGAAASTTPVQILTGVAAVSAGPDHTMAVKTDGTVWAWGYGVDGRLGNGGSGVVSTPAQISFSGAVAVAAAETHTLVLKSDGTVWAFGNNTEGQLGDGTTTQRTTAVQVLGMTGVVAIAAGRDSSYALQSDGAGGGIAWAWGRNADGQLGDGSTQRRITPVRVLGVTNARTIVAPQQGDFALAIGGDGRVYAWGENGSRQLGLGHTINQSTAVAVPAVAAARLIAAASSTGIAVDSTARAWAWGADTAWEHLAVGFGMVSSVPGRSDIGGVLGVVIGAGFTLTVQPNGTVKGYGSNGSGQLGDGTTATSETGTLASGLTLADNTFLAGDQDQDELVTWREYLLGTDPLNPDTNGNGIMDGHDDASGRDALNPDSDEDGVPNWIEEKNGTDPFRADSDGDGVSDLNDAFPLDPARSMAPSSNPSDTTPPMVTLKEPVSARPIP